MDDNNHNNGNNDFEFGNLDSFAGFSDIDFGSALKEFTGGPDKSLDPSKDINFIFRGVVPDERRAVALARFLVRCDDCEDIKHKRQALMLLASWAAIKGDRVHTLLQAVVGQLAGQAPSKKRRIWDKQESSDTVKVQSPNE